MTISASFVQRLEQSKPLFLDGGLSNQLEAQGADLNHDLWSALLLQQNPQQIVTAHRHYLNAGADCIISASYQASETGFIQQGLTAEQARKLIGKSVDLAHQAVNEFMSDNSHVTNRPLVGASVGPYGASLADGSEYSGDYGVADEVLIEFHQGRLALLDQTQADVLACETIPSLQEAKVLHQLLLSVKTPAWICFSCQDGKHLNDGSLISEVAALFVDHPMVVAVGVNCTSPQFIKGLIAELKPALKGKAVLVYPNSGEHYNADNKTWHGTADPQSCAVAAKQWLESGADIIGGCCRMGPEHIKAMRDLIEGH